MSSKSSIIIKIVLLSILAMILIGIMLFFMITSWGFKNFEFKFGDTIESKLVVSEVYDLSQVNKIDLNLRDSDVEIRYSETSEVKLEIYDKNKSKVVYGLDNGVLSVNFNKNSFICIGFCFANRKTILYLPKDFSKSINVDSASGDVEIDSFINSNIVISTASGDILVKGAKEAEINTASGEVDLRDIPIIDVKSISGDISILNVNNLSGSSVSGGIDVTGLSGFIDFKTTSGDIELNNISIERKSKLSSVSGEVDITGINQIYISTSTISGEVDVNVNDRKSDIELTIKTTSGDIDVK